MKASEEVMVESTLNSWASEEGSCPYVLGSIVAWSTQLIDLRLPG